jgi:hypothetical protein
MKGKASALARALKKAQALSREIEPLFGAMFDDVFQGHAEYKRSLDQGIEVAEWLSAMIVIPRGQKPRDAGKFLARGLAMDLVNEFSAVANGEGEVINRVASLLYEALAGRKKVDVSERPDAYKPSPIRTRFASRLTTKK